MENEHWRFGRSRLRTLYVHRNGEEQGELIGIVDTPQLASKICRAVNATKVILPVVREMRERNNPEVARWAEYILSVLNDPDPDQPDRFPSLPQRGD